MNGQSETECFLKKAAKDFPVVRVGGLAGGFDAHNSADDFQRFYRVRLD